MNSIIKFISGRRGAWATLLIGLFFAVLAYTRAMLSGFMGNPSIGDLLAIVAFTGIAASAVYFAFKYAPFTIHFTG